MIITDTLIACGKAPQVTANPDGTFDVRLFDPSHLDLLNGFELDDIIDHFGSDKLLKAIGEDDAIEAFHLYTEYDMEELENTISSLKGQLEDINMKGDFNQQWDEHKERMADQKHYINFEETNKPKNP